jgi:cytoskeletal protein CcmA (bactofilin family)
MTHISLSAAFEGDLTCEEDVTIQGRLIGSIHVRDATIIIGETAHVESTIRAARIVVHGTLHGAVTGTARIEIGPTAVVTGDLSATHVIVADGAQFNGRIDMGKRTIAAKVAQYKTGK